MAQPNRPPILGSFEHIGEEVKQELTNLPGDIVGQALESVGLHMGGKQSGKPTPGATQDPQSAWQQFDQHSADTKHDIARKALEELTAPRPEDKQPSIWEQNMQEQEQKKQLEAQQKAMSSSVSLPSSGQRKVPGIKSAVTSKQSSEIGKNIKQD